MKTHLVIPDTQVKTGVDLSNLDWIGKYIAARQPDVIIHLGDHWDLPSLSSWDRGKLDFEGRRYRCDVDAGIEGMFRLLAPMRQLQEKQRAQKRKIYNPEMHFTMGNHEFRADRMAQDHPELEGFVGTAVFREFLEDEGFQVHDYTVVVDIDGVWYTHCMINEMTGRPIGAMASTMLKQVGNSFTMGHRQTLDQATRFIGPKMQRALIAGASYLHNEDYKGPPRDESVRSGNNHWRGIIVKHDVSDGEYSLMEIPLDYLCRRYEKMPLREYLSGHPHRNVS